MKKSGLALLASCLLFSPSAFSTDSLPPLQTPAPYSPPAPLKPFSSELSILLSMLKRFRTMDLKVVCGSREYNAVLASGLAAVYLAQTYKSENAESWVRAHAYRSPRGHVLYLKYPDGKLRVLRDVLIEELNKK